MTTVYRRTVGAWTDYLGQAPGGSTPVVPSGGTITHGVQLTASNTGLDSGTTLAVLNSQPNGTYTAKHFQTAPSPGFWQVGSGSVFTNCKFTDTVIVRGSNITFTNCEFAGNISVANSQNVTLTRCHGYTGADMSNLTADDPKGSSLCSAIQFTECLFDQPGIYAGAHVDGIQAHGVNGFTATRCAWNFGTYKQVNGENAYNACLFFDGDNTFGGHKNILVEDCYVNGAGNTVYLRNGSAGSTSGDNVRYRNLYMGSDYFFGLVVNDTTYPLAEWSAYRYPAMTAVAL